ncbi:tetratricopeptide repeat protein [Pengzhenrongella sp.]|jgi:tetratricopeptide (TPR) repeat protein|uniref:tetratricopeptide repeat protein n=1 Tax=Pengzhenrongella sp. TaxID=2888820 RepID=UPI002F94E2CA
MTSAAEGAESDLDRASVLCDLRRWDEAARRLRTILATDPHSEKGLCLLARSQIGQRAFDEALRTSQAAIAENPANDWPHRLAGLALEGLGRHPEAQAMARTAVRLAPHASQCHTYLARVLARSGSDLVEARAAADRAVALAPHTADSFLTVGMVAAADRRDDDAVAAFHRALAIDPDNTGAHNELGRVRLARSQKRARGTFVNVGGLAQAADGFAAAVRVDPHAAVSRRNLDVVLHLFQVRTTQAFVVVAWVAMVAHRSIGSDLARVLPAVLLAFPSVFVVRFVSHLGPQVREYLQGLLRNRLIAGAVAADCLAVAGIVLGAALPRTTTIAFGCSFALALLALLAMGVQTRRNFRAPVGVTRYRISTARLRIGLLMMILTLPVLLLPVAGSAEPVPLDVALGGAAEFACLVILAVMLRRSGAMTWRGPMRRRAGRKRAGDRAGPGPGSVHG